MTDTDDYFVAQDEKRPVAQLPIRIEGQTICIPNSVAILRGTDNLEAARKLVDYLLSTGVEEYLATGPSGQIPLNPKVDVTMKVKTPREVKAMRVDWKKAADEWGEAAQFIRDEFATAE